MRRAVLRIGHEIVEKHGSADGLALVGVERRGAILADRIAGGIATRTGSRIPVARIDVRLHRVDAVRVPDEDVPGCRAEATPAAPGDAREDGEGPAAARSPDPATARSPDPATARSSDAAAARSWDPAADASSDPNAARSWGAGNEPGPFAFDPRVTTMVIVDDVLCTGRTAQAALQAIVERGWPRAIRLAVLVDRGHREMPIRADHVGRNIPTSRDEVVCVRLADLDGRDEVVLLRGDAPAEVVR
jgi:pyrimidine operon attenuation protein/uracil phosphoribosyltransferase